MEPSSINNYFLIPITSFDEDDHFLSFENKHAYYQRINTLGHMKIYDNELIFEKFEFSNKEKTVGMYKNKLEFGMII